MHSIEKCVIGRAGRKIQSVGRLICRKLLLFMIYCGPGEGRGLIFCFCFFPGDKA